MEANVTRRGVPDRGSRDSGAPEAQAPMGVLVTWASKRGGTEGIARAVGDALAEAGLVVEARPVDEVKSLTGFDAVVVGGALYANRWPAAARRWVRRHVAELRRVPVWFFSSGPLDDSADRGEIPATSEVSALAERVGALGHVTFGGRLAPDARGFPASAMAKERSGDFRNFTQIRAWAAGVAAALPDATPGVALEHPARSTKRLLGYGATGWALAAITMGIVLRVASVTAAVVVHAVFAPLLFGALSVGYFRARGAREALSVATTWALIFGALDVAVRTLPVGAQEAFGSPVGTLLPAILIGLVTWAVGAAMAVMPKGGGPATRGTHANDRLAASGA